MAFHGIPWHYGTNQSGHDISPSSHFLSPLQQLRLQPHQPRRGQTPHGPRHQPLLQGGARGILQLSHGLQGFQDQVLRFMGFWGEKM